MDRGAAASGPTVLVAAGTARGGGGQLASRAVSVALAARGSDTTIILPSKADLHEYHPALRYRRWKSARAVISEVLGLSLRGVDVYVGMSDRLPLVRRAPTNIIVAQNPHLYGRSTEPASMLQAARRAVLRAWAKRSYRHADWIVVATAASRQEVVASTRVPANRVVVRPIPPQDVPTTIAGINLHVERVVLVGDVYAYKRFDLAVQELERWAEKHGRALVVVHVGKLLERAASRAFDTAAAGCRQVRVEKLGSRSHVEAMSAIASADLLVFPSDRESFGLPLAEALACGVPAICRDIPQFREIGGTAVGYFTDEPGDLGRALDDCAPVDVRRVMAAAGLERAMPNGGWDVLEPPEQHDNDDVDAPPPPT